MNTNTWAARFSELVGPLTQADTQPEAPPPPRQHAEGHGAVPLLLLGSCALLAAQWWVWTGR